MKKTATVFVLGMLLGFSNLLHAQQSTQNNETRSYRGEFHIGLTDLAFLEEGESKFRIMPRFGYILTCPPKFF